MKNPNWRLILAEGLALLLRVGKGRRSPLTRVGSRTKLLERGLAGLEKRLRKSARSVGRVRS